MTDSKDADPAKDEEALKIGAEILAAAKFNYNSYYDNRARENTAKHKIREDELAKLEMNDAPQMLRSLERDIKHAASRGESELRILHSFAQRDRYAAFVRYAKRCGFRVRAGEVERRYGWPESEYDSPNRFYVSLHWR